MRVAFVHPDLGLGGAERLIVDAACALVRRHHEVWIFTPYFDPHRCFSECTPASSSVSSPTPPSHRVTYTASSFFIQRAGGLWPRTILNKAQAICTYIRCCLAALAVVAKHMFTDAKFDVAFVDSVSACVPILQLCGIPVLFYCHYPDTLLQRAAKPSLLRRVYRAPVDALEKYTTRGANAIAVNSEFTARAYRLVFDKHANPTVLYPPAPVSDATTCAKTAPANPPVLLSINRFEGKKNLPLALDAMRKLRSAAEDVPRKNSAAARALQTKLVFAGGCDARVTENAEQLCMLKLRADHQHLVHDTVRTQHIEDEREAAETVRSALNDTGTDVVFFPSCSDAVKRKLIDACTCLVYTPEGEHFGIAPLEAAIASRPTVACASGEPLETIAHGTTGYLCESGGGSSTLPGVDGASVAVRELTSCIPSEDASLAASFARHYACMMDETVASELGTNAKKRCLSMFTRDAFGERLEAALSKLVVS